MKGIRKLVLLGVLLVTLLVVIDFIDAAKKEPKQKEPETKTVNQKQKKLENLKPEKAKKSKEQKSTRLEEDVKAFKDAKFETKKLKVKRETTYTAKDSKTEGVNPKIAKSYQKVKKYKFVEDEPAQRFTSKVSSKAKNIKITKNKLPKEKDNIQDVINELNRMYNEENIIIEEENSPSQKKKKYRVIDVTVQEDGEEEKEASETLAEEDLEEEEPSRMQKTESAEVIGKFKKTTVKLPKTKKLYKKTVEPVEEDLYEEPTNEDYFYNNTDEHLETEFSEDSPSDVPTYSSRYEDPNTQPNCKSYPEDPNRQGPKKLTHYVFEEEVDGKIKKRVVSEEDGITMCEVADLLKTQYDEYLNENPEE